ncbi:MAG: tetratricopeptide repeat protein [Trichodesmium sp. St2_bin6]|nr:tetratricopeptide repeat protein [Trichodesmium sp. MAG_R01]MDE5070431.1 tetratricopeptide repeat protein [Trichodesmium sp. St5_bin8]MDE5078610.1 tetratricopeptide repeat protein [Trichodesmium sp. St2_bin6]MDE5091758.1 tetratricopeptide repeat protein [Trichodesmium sp. St18_bin3_1_1]
MFRRIWQWLKSLWEKFLGLLSRPQVKPTDPKPLSESLPPLTDTDYDFLFGQLLEGIAQGWYPERVKNFFDDLGERGKPESWLEWLQRFGKRLLASPKPNDELAQRMVRFAHLTQTLPSLHTLADLANNIGTELLSRDNSGAIWEYDGPDSSFSPPPQASLGENQENEDLENLVVKLQENPNLLATVAQQLGIQTSDPRVVIQAMVSDLGVGVEIQQSAEQNSEIWAKLGLEQAKAGDFAGAVDSWESALVLKPDYHQVWYNRGKALVQLGRYESAITSHDKALEIKSDDYLAWNNRGEALGKLERWEEAITSCDKALEINSDYYLAWYNKANFLVSLGNLTQAVNCYDKALEIKPNFYDGWYERGNVFKDLGLMAEAYESWEKAGEIQPE